MYSILPGPRFPPGQSPEPHPLPGGGQRRGTPQAVISRWLKKIEALQQKKNTYEQVLKRQLDSLDRDFALLQMQSEELSVRAGKSQIKMPLAA